MSRIRAFLISKPVFLYLLPVFFVLHGFVENVEVLPVKESLVLLGIYLGIAVALSGLFWLFYRNFHKANLVAFCLMAFNFFFGSVHDFLKETFSHFIFIKYSFIIPAVLIVFILLFIYVKKQKIILQQQSDI